jgi:hypothetical protein
LFSNSVHHGAQSWPDIIRKYTETFWVPFNILIGTERRLRHYRFVTVSCGEIDVIGRDYFTAEAETLLELAKSAADPQVAASLIERAADLKALVDELGAPDPIPRPSHHPYIEAS